MADLIKLESRRPVLGFDRTAIAERNRRAFAQGNQSRRVQIAAGLDRCRELLLAGRLSILIESRAAELVALMNKASLDV